MRPEVSAVVTPVKLLILSKNKDTKEPAVDSPLGPEAGRQRSNPVVERCCVDFFCVFS